jgi:hypothetical protein
MLQATPAQPPNQAPAQQPPATISNRAIMCMPLELIHICMSVVELMPLETHTRTHTHVGGGATLPRLAFFHPPPNSSLGPLLGRRSHCSVPRSPLLGRRSCTPQRAQFTPSRAQVMHTPESVPRSPLLGRRSHRSVPRSPLLGRRSHRSVPRSPLLGRRSHRSVPRSPLLHLSLIALTL